MSSCNIIIKMTYNYTFDFILKKDGKDRNDFCNLFLILSHIIYMRWWEPPVKSPKELIILDLMKEMNNKIKMIDHYVSLLEDMLSFIFFQETVQSASINFFEFWTPVILFWELGAVNGGSQPDRRQRGRLETKDNMLVLPLFVG